MPSEGSGDAASAAMRRLQEQIRTLHALRTEARLQPEFETGYVRFLRSLRERLHPRGQSDLRTVSFPDGLTFRVDLGDRLGCDVFYGYLEERFEAGIFEDVLQPGATMVDVGANFGYYAIRCARAVGPNGAVYAFEPDPHAFSLLTANIAENGLEDHLHPQQAAVAGTDGEVTFYQANEAAFSSMTDTGRSATRAVLTVPSHRLDTFAAAHGVEQIDGLKIDVEGHEAAVLRGGAGIIRRSPDPLLMLEVSAKNLTDTARAALLSVLDDLFRQGFRAVVPDLSIDGGLRTLDTAAATVELPAANVFLLREGGPASQRLRSAVARRLSDPQARVSHAEASPDDTADADVFSRPVTLFAGIDPDLVAAALRDKAEAEEHATDLANTILRLREEVHLLRADSDRLRAEIRAFGASPFGLAYRALRKAGRMVWSKRGRQT